MSILIKIHIKIKGVAVLFIHKNIFKGKVLRKIYSIRKNTCTEKITQEEFVEYKILCECKNEIVFKIGERYHVDKLDITVTIEDIIKGENGEYIYYTDYISIIEDEKSKLSEQETNKIIKEYLDMVKKKDKEREERIKQSMIEPIKEVMTNGYYYIARGYFSYCGIQKPYLTQSIIEAYDFSCRHDYIDHRNLSIDIRFMLEKYSIPDKFEYKKIYENVFNELCEKEGKYIGENGLHDFYPYYKKDNKVYTYKDLNKTRNTILRATAIIEGQGFMIKHGSKVIRKITKNNCNNINMYAFNYLIKICDYNF